MTRNAWMPASQCASQCRISTNKSRKTASWESQVLGASQPSCQLPWRKSKKWRQSICSPLQIPLMTLMAHAQHLSKMSRTCWVLQPRLCSLWLNIWMKPKHWYPSTRLHPRRRAEWRAVNTFVYGPDGIQVQGCIQEGELRAGYLCNLSFASCFWHRPTYKFCNCAIMFVGLDVLHNMGFVCKQAETCTSTSMSHTWQHKQADT